MQHLDLDDDQTAALIVLLKRTIAGFLPIPTYTDKPEATP
jgi:hypothetical protein